MRKECALSIFLGLFFCLLTCWFLTHSQTWNISLKQPESKNQYTKEARQVAIGKLVLDIPLWFNLPPSRGSVQRMYVKTFSWTFVWQRLNTIYEFVSDTLSLKTALYFLTSLTRSCHLSKLSLLTYNVSVIIITSSFFLQPFQLLVVVNRADFNLGSN